MWELIGLIITRMVMNLRGAALLSAAPAKYSDSQRRVAAENPDAGSRVWEGNPAHSSVAACGVSDSGAAQQMALSVPN